MGVVSFLITVSRIHATSICSISLFFFFNDTATTEIYTLSLHDALPICRAARAQDVEPEPLPFAQMPPAHVDGDRKSTRLNSSHSQISYAVFCLKKKTSLSILIPLTNSLSSRLFPCFFITLTRSIYASTL